MLSSLAPARRRLVLGTVVLLVVAVAAILVVSLVGPGRSRSAPVAQGTAGPVVLVRVTTLDVEAALHHLDALEVHGV